jgi:Cytochrome P460
MAFPGADAANVLAKEGEIKERTMLGASARALKHLGALGAIAAVTICTALITKSAAQDGKEGQAQAATTGSNGAAPLFGIKVFPGWRDWRLVSVAHEAGELNDIRAILGNDVAIKAYREGTLPFPDGTVIARVAWKYVPSEENDKAFGRSQSFVPGAAPDWYLQFMVKDSKKYAATGGWGFAQFGKDGHPTANEAKLGTCFPCHEPAKAQDFVFTRYAP